MYERFTQVREIAESILIREDLTASKVVETHLPHAIKKARGDVRKIGLRGLVLDEARRIGAIRDLRGSPPHTKVRSRSNHVLPSFIGKGFGCVI